MTFLLSPQFRKDVKDLPKDTRERVKKALIRLRDEDKGDIENIERDLWRLRVGDYRIFYYPKNDETYILRVVHRRKAYRPEAINALLKKITKLSKGD